MNNQNVKSVPSERKAKEILRPEYYVEGLDPRGAFITPSAIIGRHVKELKDAVVSRIFGEENKKEEINDNNGESGPKP